MEAGINGLVAANYLIKNGFDVSIIEKKSQTGGACIKDTVEIQNKKIDFAYGATVLGMMPDFIFEETGLSKKIQWLLPKEHQSLYILIDQESSTRIYQDHH